MELNIKIIPNEFMVGLSGGMDSVSLVYWLKENNYNFTAIHINHDINKDSDSWELFCKNLCEKLNIPFISEKVKLERGNLENQARIARYNVFSKYTTNVVLAHHEDDQLETFFLKLLRGSGIIGLTSMDEISRNFNVNVFRPMLNISRSTIEEYFYKNNLECVEDPSNKDTRYDRNYIRSILPNLKNKFNNLKGVLKSLERLNETESLLMDLYILDNEKIGYPMSLKTFSKLSPERIKNYLYSYGRKNDGKVSCGLLTNSVKMIKNYKPDKKMELDFGNFLLKQNGYYLWKIDKVNEVSDFL